MIQLTHISNVLNQNVFLIAYKDFLYCQEFNVPYSDSTIEENPNVEWGTTEIVLYLEGSTIFGAFHILKLAILTPHPPV